MALAARNIEGAKGAINFAGYGRTARTPMLWLYSENDKYWGKDLPRKWLADFRAQGGDALFVQLPAHGQNGPVANHKKENRRSPQRRRR